MPPSKPASDLEFYRALRQYDLNQPAVQTALAFARTWADLARRVLAALCAQEGEEVYYPQALALPALLAYLEGGPFDEAARFLRHAPAGWDGLPLQLLAEMAAWLSRGFDPADPIGSSYQVWVGKPGERRVLLYGRDGPGAPPPPLELAPAPPSDAWFLSGSDRPVSLIAHYDVHGLSMLALSLRYLQGQGVSQVDGALGFEWTGDISKLWKRAVVKTMQNPAGYSHVVLIDCSVHSRQPEYTFKAVARLESAPHCQLVLIDHHADTFQLAPHLQHPRLSLVLTDVLGCGLTRAFGPVERDLMVLGGLSDKVPEVARAFPPATHSRLYEAAAAFHRRAVGFSPTPPAFKEAGLYPLRPLWEALAGGAEITPGLAAETLGPVPEEPEPRLPEFTRVGSLLLATEKLSKIGRTWYALLERLMEREGAYYSAALRLLDEARANVLLLTDWRHPELPPVRLFIPEVYLPRCLGHPTAVWADIERGEALEFLGAVAGRLNQFLGTPGDFESAARLLTHGVLEPPADT